MINLRRLSIGTIAAAIIGTLAISPSAAHIGVTADDPAEGTRSVLKFDVAHGCGEAGTTDIIIQIPEDVTSVTPTAMPGWEIQTESVDLVDPLDDGHGGQITQRVSEVHFHADKPLPTDLRQVFEISVMLPQASAGQTLAFPAIQTCEEGEIAWIQIPAQGEEPDQLDEPAPILEIVATDSDSETTARVTEVSTLTVIALIFALGGLVLGVIGITRTRKAA